MYSESFTDALRCVVCVFLIILGGTGFAESTFRETITNGTPSAVSSAIEAGADVNAPFGDDGWTPLDVALTYNSTLDVVRVLLEGGADAGAADQMQNTHLHTDPCGANSPHARHRSIPLSCNDSGVNGPWA